MGINYGERALLEQYSNNSIIRYVIVDNPKMSDEEKNAFITRINRRLNYMIQTINIEVTGRVLPFVKVRRVVIENNDELRIIINEMESSKTLKDYEVLEPEKISHLINFRRNTSQRIIKVCDSFIPGDAKMLIDVESQCAAAVDIFLDIAMFHSYSFLDQMDLESKKGFNEIKFKHFIDKNYNCFYDIEKDNLPAFLSFAFAARTDINDFDLYYYCQCWDDFIKEHFENNQHTLLGPEEQLKKHSQIGMLDNKYFDPYFWKQFEKGDYLFLRINREPNLNEQKQEIANYFHVKEFHIGPVKIVPVGEYYKQFLKKQIDEHYISAFKIIV